jgi:capsular polysaccharide biosynthesis protein
MLSEPPCDRWARRVESADALLDGAARRLRIWTPRPAEILRGHPGLLADLCQTPPGFPLPWMVPDFAYPAHHLRYLRLRNVVLFPRESVVMPRPGLVSAETQQDWRSTFGDLPGVEGYGTPRPRLRVDTARPRVRAAGLRASLCHVHQHVYGHWLGDVLPGLLDLLDAVQAGRLRLLSPPLAGWQRRYLALLGVPAGAVEELDARSVLCEDLVWSTYATTIHSHQPTPIIETVYARLAAAADRGRPTDRPRLLYVSRLGLARPGRRCVNEPALAVELARLGFTAVSPERLTVDEQITLFSGASAIVGLTGSGLANVGFAPRGCLVVDILSPRQPVAWLFRLTRQLGQRYLCLVGEELPDGDRPDSAPDALPAPYGFRVDVGRFVEIVRAALGRVGLAAAP